MKPVPPYLMVKFGEEVWHDEPYDQSPADFFDRDEPKKQALAILHSPETRRAIWLFGERRSGKTSMLKLLIDKFKEQEGYLAIEVPWQSIHSSDDFYKEYLHQLDNALDPKSILPVNPGLSFWDALRERQEKIGQRMLVVGIDEIDSIIIEKVDENSRGEILGCVLRLVTQEPNIKVILTSVRSSSEIEHFKASPLVSKSQPINIPYFSTKDIENLIRSLAINISEVEIEQIRNLSGGWPYYAKSILVHLLQFPETEPQRLGYARIKAVKDISQQTCGHLYDHHWDKNERRALWLLANKEQIKLEEFNQLDAPLRTALRELTERGYVIEENGQYRFRVVLIADWFKSWSRRDIEEDKLEIPLLLKKLINSWAIEPGEQVIKITKEDLRHRGF